MKLPLLVVVSALACAGCESVAFQAAPVPAQACDAALVGTWLSKGKDGDADGEAELRIAPDCRLRLVEHGKKGTVEGEPVQLHVGRDDGIGYAWVDARWVEARMSDSAQKQLDGGDAAGPAEDESRFVERDVMLFRYRVTGDALAVDAADARRFAHRIVDNEIRGEIARDATGDMRVRVLAPLPPEQVRDDALFPPGEMRFVRAPAGG